MKKISIILCMSLISVIACAQVYFYNSTGLIAEYESAPDSVITIPLYRTPMPAQNEGALSGIFSVSQTRKVRFSKGNLQYGTSTGVWKFAEHQYDTVGGNVSNASIDLFGYGTSGWAGSGANAYMPTSTSTDESDYQAVVGDAVISSLTGYMEQRDWGVYNAIQNGGNKAGLWRLLTYSEMQKVLTYRWEPYAQAYVNGVLGIVLFPDNWNDANNPNEFKIHPYIKFDKQWRTKTSLTEEQISEILKMYNNDTLRAHSELLIDVETRVLVEEGHALEEYNVTPAEWLQYEALGCVFLPFVTSRSNPENVIKNIASGVQATLYSLYWTSYYNFALGIRYISPTTAVNPSPINVQNIRSCSPYIGGCVRLVQDY